MAKNVNIKINANSKNAETGIKKVESGLNSFAKAVQKSPVTSLSKSISAVSIAFTATAGAVKKAVSAMNELSQTNLAQVKAEKQLEAAAKNNPFLNKQSVQSLKEYASGLQKISTTGDEVLLPMMSQLAAAGRTQNEIQQIMSAALDVSASGAMSLDSAVRNLNATYGGTIGQLGETIPQVKNLTQEQLKNGEAVKLVAKQYKGMAEEVASSTGAADQMKNAWGDLKEAIGAGFTFLFTPVQKFFTWAIEGINNIVSGFNKIVGIANTGETSDIKQSEKLKTELDALDDEYKTLSAKIKDNEDKLSELKEKEQDSAIAKNANSRAQKQKEALEKEIQSYKDDLAEWKDYITPYYEKKAKLEEELQEKYGDYNVFYHTKKENEQYKKERAPLDEELKSLKNEIEKYENYVNEVKPNLELKQIELQTLLSGEFISNTGFNSTSTGAESALLEQKARLEELKNKITKKTKEYNSALSKEAEAAKTVSEQDQKAIDIITKNRQALEKQLETIKAKYDLEEEKTGTRDTIAEQLDIISAKEQSYISLITEDSSAVTQNNSAAKAKLQNLEEEWRKLEGLTGGYEQYKEIVNKYHKEQSKSQLEILNEDLLKLEEAKSKFEELGLSGSDSMNKIKEAITEINSQIDQIETENLLFKMQQVADGVSQIVSDIGGVMNQAFDLALKNNEQEVEEEQSALEESYTNGELSYEEYIKKKEELDKEAARKEYRIKMAQWTVDLAMATAKAAQAVVNALASGAPPINIINSVTAGALGALQVATIAANKPSPPSFSTGGFLTGSSTSGDKIPFMGNAGEAVLNSAEQRTFMEMANGNYNGGPKINMPISIINNDAGDVQVSTETNQREIKITVDKIVNKSFQDGIYTNSMQTAQNNTKGVRYL
jgi:hypothetical protein